MTGRTHKQIAAGQRRRLLAMANKLQEMAYAWDGIDEFNIGELEDLKHKVNSVAEKMIPDDK